MCHSDVYCCRVNPWITGIHIRRWLGVHITWYSEKVIYIVFWRRHWHCCHYSLITIAKSTYFMIVLKVKISLAMLIAGIPMPLKSPVYHSPNFSFCWVIPEQNRKFARCQNWSELKLICWFRIAIISLSSSSTGESGNNSSPFLCTFLFFSIFD